MQSDDKKLIPPDSGIYLGAFPDVGGTEDSVTLERLEKFTELSGKKPAWIYFSNNWYNGIKFPKEEVKIIHEFGSVPFIRLMPRSDYDTFEDPETGFTLERIIRGDFDNELMQWARDAKESKVSLLLEFGTEVNGSWFPWNGKYNGGKEKNYGDPDEYDGPEKFRDAYRHIIDIFREQNAENVTWFYHVNAYSSPNDDWNDYKNYYPGDNYIDWIGVSVYGPQTKGSEWKTFSEIMDEKYFDLAAISYNKPLAVLEFGVTEDSGTGDKAWWIQEALQSIQSGKYPRVKGISYWSSKWQNEDGSISDLRINSSERALEFYRNGISSPFFLEEAIIR